MFSKKLTRTAKHIIPQILVYEKWGQPRGQRTFCGGIPSDPLLHFILTTATDDRIIQATDSTMLICQKLWWCLGSHHLVQCIQRSAAFPEVHDEQMVSTGHQPTHAVTHWT